MKLNTTLTTWGLLATLTAGGVIPALADGYRDRSSDQTSKNNARNLAIGAAAVAAYGLFSHNNTATLLGAAGAALAGSQYEKDRKQQSQNGRRYYSRDGQNYRDGQTYRDGRNYRDGQDYRDGQSYSRDGWSGGQDNSGRDNGGRSWGGGRDNGVRDNRDRDSDDRYNSRDNAWSQNGRGR